MNWCQNIVFNGCKKDVKKYVKKDVKYVKDYY